MEPDEWISGQPGRTRLSGLAVALTDALHAVHEGRTAVSHWLLAIFPTRSLCNLALGSSIRGELEEEVVAALSGVALHPLDGKLEGVLARELGEQVGGVWVGIRTLVVPVPLRLQSLADAA